MSTNHQSFYSRISPLCNLMALALVVALGSFVEAGAQWTTNGNNINNANSGNVGVGTTAPSRKLQVVTTSSENEEVMSVYRAAASNTSGGRSRVSFEFRGDAYSDNPNVYGWTLFGNGVLAKIGAAPQSYTELGSAISGTHASLGFFVNSAGHGGLLERMTILGNGKVGIGTTTPTKPLDVVGDINASGTITGDTINAKYKDVAEWVDSSQDLPGGTVVVLDTSKSNHVVAATQSYDSRVAGVISLRPGLTLGEQGEGRVLVATTGRVKVKVDATNGPIQIGDLLVTSDRAGYAMKSVPVYVGGVRIHRPGTLIGKALEPLAQGIGEILVLLSLQ